MRQTRCNGTQRMRVFFIIVVLLCWCLPSGALAAKKQLRIEWNELGINETIFKEVAAQWAAEHPDVELTATSIIGIHGSAWFQNLLVRLATGVDIPDVYMIEQNKAMRLIAEGRIMPVDDLIKRDAVNMNDLVPGSITSLSYNGKIYGLPSRMDVILFFFNKQILANAGFARPTNNWTQNEFTTIAKRMTRDVNNDGVTDIWGAEMSRTNYVFNAISSTFGATLMDASGVSFDSPKSIEALEWVISLVDRGYVPNPQKMPAGVSFSAANVGMAMQYSWSINNFRQLPALEWDILPMPVGPTGKGNLLLGNMFMIDAHTKETDLAWDLVKTFTSVQTQRRQSIEAGAVFPRRSFFAQNIYRNDALPPENWAAVYDAFTVASAYPAIGELDDFRTMLATGINEAFSKTKTPDQALRDAANQVRILLKMPLK